jgi:hypothetical protein
MWPALAGCGDLFGDHTLSSDPIDGIVVDNETQTPLSGALVVGQWEGDRGGPVQSGTVLVHVETATSDKHGRFNMRAWNIPNAGDSMSRIRNLRVIVWSYAPGYMVGIMTKTPPQTIPMTPFAGTRMERFQLLSRLAIQTGGEYDNSIKNLTPLRLALSNEAHAIAQTNLELGIAKSIAQELNLLCSVAPGQRIQDFTNSPPAPDVQRIWPPPPCTLDQLKER